MEGLRTPVPLLMAAAGPLALAPAHTVQLCHPDILWIPAFTVCAEAGTLVATVTARIADNSQLFLRFFDIFFLSKVGWIFYCLAIGFSVAGWRLSTHLLCLNQFQPLRAIRWRT
jgi:hypothetical protein